MIVQQTVLATVLATSARGLRRGASDPESEARNLPRNPGQTRVSRVFALIPRNPEHPVDVLGDPRDHLLQRAGQRRDLRPAGVLQAEIARTFCTETTSDTVAPCMGPWGEAGDGLRMVDFADFRGSSNRVRVSYL